MRQRGRQSAADLEVNGAASVRAEPATATSPDREGGEIVC